MRGLDLSRLAWRKSSYSGANGSCVRGRAGRGRPEFRAQPDRGAGLEGPRRSRAGLHRGSVARVRGRDQGRLARVGLAADGPGADAGPARPLMGTSGSSWPTRTG